MIKFLKQVYFIGVWGMNKSKKTRQNLKNRKKWLLPVLLALLVLGTALPAFAVRADETEDELLVGPEEVVEVLLGTVVPVHYVHRRVVPAVVS